MHPEQQIFCLNVKLKFFPLYVPFHNADVLDCGSRDINGNNMFLFHGSRYTGTDICEGPNVDVVCATHLLEYPDASFDTIICTEVLEHDPYWPDSIRNMLRMLKPGGLLIITCAGPERGPHSMHQPGGLTEGEYYRNLDFQNIWHVGQERDFIWFGTTETEIGLPDKFSDFSATYGREGKDIYFWGIKSEEGQDG